MHSSPYFPVDGPLTRFTCASSTWSPSRPSLPTRGRSRPPHAAPGAPRGVTATKKQQVLEMCWAALQPQSHERSSPRQNLWHPAGRSSRADRVVSVGLWHTRGKWGGGGGGDERSPDLAEASLPTSGSWERDPVSRLYIFFLF